MGPVSYLIAYLSSGQQVLGAGAVSSYPLLYYIQCRGRAGTVDAWQTAMGFIYQAGCLSTAEGALGGPGLACSKKRGAWSHCLGVTCTQGPETGWPPGLPQPGLTLRGNLCFGKAADLR